MTASSKSGDKLTIADKQTEANLTKTTSAATIMTDLRVKDRLEKKAFAALERRLEPRHKMCKPCSGEGEKSNGDPCAMCQGEGFVVEDADMRAVELVLAPKFPKTQINVNADLDGMTPEALIGMIEGI